MALVLHTGPIYASIDRSDPDHVAIVELLRSEPRPHYVIEPVLVEVDYWVRKLLDVSALEAFVADIGHGRYELFALDADDVTRAVELEAQYADADIGFVDAAIVAACERLDARNVVTFDKRHFAMIRAKGRKNLELLP